MGRMVPTVKVTWAGFSIHLKEIISKIRSRCTGGGFKENKTVTFDDHVLSSLYVMFSSMFIGLQGVFSDNLIDNCLL